MGARSQAHGAGPNVIRRMPGFDACPLAATADNPFATSLKPEPPSVR